MRLSILFTLVSFLFLSQVWGQDTDLLLNHDGYHYIDRLDIRGYTDDVVHTDIKPYGRLALKEVFDKVDTSRMGKNERKWNHHMRILLDDQYATEQQGKGLFKVFYKNKRDFYHYKGKALTVFVNPVLYTSWGQDFHNYNGDTENRRISYNTRGLVIRGSLFDKVGFYSEAYDNQSFFPQFVQNRYEETDALFGETFIKPFKPDTSKNTSGLDYFSSRAYITYSPHKAIRIKFGKDRAFWGNGFQNLVLSDYAADYLMLSINTRFWKMEYTNHFMQMIDFIPNKPDQIGTFPRKYGAFHQLSYKPNKNLSVGFFESIIYASQQPNGNRGFELQYLNPVIFYRSVEQLLGSPDNAFFGFNLKYNFLKHFQVYGQFLLDDFNFSRRNQGSKYWGNKFGYQAGLKYIDAFTIPTLDLQIEYNRLRPYTYQHFNISANYAHYGQYLGHASGGNLSDIYFGLRYHPIPSLNIQFSYSRMMKGLDEPGVNNGGDITKSYSYDRPREFDHVPGQGVALNVNTLFGRLTYQIMNTDVYVELEGRYRTENDFKSASILGGIRANIAPRPIKF